MYKISGGGNSEHVYGYSGNTLNHAEFVKVVNISKTLPRFRY